MIRNTLWEPLVWCAYSAIAVSGICGLVYITMQQNYRQNANDPQIQMAEDGAAKLDRGDVPASLVERNAPLEDLQTSLLPWITVYDSAGTPLESDAEFANAPPQLPKGVFDVNAPPMVDGPVWRSGEDRITWQPEPGVRQAVVLVQTSDKKYFVAAGRSLSETEIRISQLGFLVLAAWAFTLSCLLAASFIGWWLLKYKK